MDRVTASWVGTELAAGRYRVTEKLGSGGMGAVYRAHDDNLETDVVIKVPHPHMLEDETFAARFRREIRALVSLTHPHVVKIHDVGEHEGVPFAVMQYLGGGCLEDRLTSGMPVDPDSLATWLPDVAKALDSIHRKGFVHRDIKPANIFFDDEGLAYVGDFGIAKVVADAQREGHTDNLTGTGLAMGTVDYMAPEVLRNEPYDGRVDQHALAIILCEILSGQRPFRATTPAAVIAEKVTKQPAKLSMLRSDLPTDLAGAIDRGMSPNPKGRYSTCTEFASAVLSPEKSAVPAIRRACPLCGRRLRLKPDMAGRRVSCPHCKSQLTVAADLSELHGPPPSPAPPRPAAHAPPPIQTPPPFTEPVRCPETASVLSGPTPSVGNVSQPVERLARPTPGWVAMARQVLHHPATWIGGGVVLIFGLLMIVIASMLPRDTEEPTARGTRSGGEIPADPPIERTPTTSPGPPLESSAPSFSASKTNSLGMEFVLIPAGEFMMGSPEDEEDRDDNEGPVHRVRITQPFYLGIHEVTQDQWKSLMGTTPWKGENYMKEGPDYAASYVSWEDAQSFVKKLSSREAREGRRYRLPTEAEWEYACRAGTSGAYCFGSDASRLGEYAWYGGIFGNGNCKSEQYAHRVGQKKPNGWGLYDMRGNVLEWCGDLCDWDYYGKSSTDDPSGPSSGGVDRVLRGGGWAGFARYCRSAQRDRSSPVNRFMHYGFRVALVPAE